MVQVGPTWYSVPDTEARALAARLATLSWEGGTWSEKKWILELDLPQLLCSGMVWKILGPSPDFLSGPFFPLHPVPRPNCKLREVAWFLQLLLPPHTQFLTPSLGEEMRREVEACAYVLRLEEMGGLGLLTDPLGI